MLWQVYKTRFERSTDFMDWTWISFIVRERRLRKEHGFYGLDTDIIYCSGKKVKKRTRILWIGHGYFILNLHIKIVRLTRIPSNKQRYGLFFNPCGRRCGQIRVYPCYKIYTNPKICFIITHFSPGLAMGKSC